MINNLDKKSVENKNIKFFDRNINYQKNIEKIDTYKNINFHLSKSLDGTDFLLDIGHGGIFDYQTVNIKQICGLDLSVMNYSNLPKNIKLFIGSVLNIPKNLNSFDKVLMNMLLHHVTGKNVEENFNNLRLSINQAKKALKKNGELIIVESCVPYWFYLFEKIVYRLASFFLLKFFNHPPVFQYTSDQILKVLKESGFKKITLKKIKQGKLILQFGYKFPSFLTPVSTIIFKAT